MNPVAACAAAFMEANPHPALRLGELLEPVADRVDRSLTLDRLRASLAEHPECFRLLDPWRGPWRASVPASSEVATIRDARRTGARIGASDSGTSPDVWIVLTSGPGAPVRPAPCPQFTLRESVRWLATCVDARSAVSVSRWYAIALAERESRRALARRAA